MLNEENDENEENEENEENDEVNLITVFDAWDNCEEGKELSVSSVEELFAFNSPGMFLGFLQDIALNDFVSYMENNKDWLFETPQDIRILCTGFFGQFSRWGTVICLFTDAYQNRKELHFLPRPVTMYLFPIEDDGDEEIPSIVLSPDDFVKV
jgi:hypothetical protein